MTDDRIPGIDTLGEGPPPPASLERRTLDRLRARGLLASRPARRALRAGIALAAAAAFFAAGIAAGRLISPSAGPPEGRKWMLLLREDAGFDPEGLARHDPGALVREYAAWARAGARETVLGGERLEDEGRIVRAGGGRLIVEPLTSLAGDAGGRIGGYFLIRAEDLEEAVRLAGSCPHLTHGGSIEVREVGR